MNRTVPIHRLDRPRYNKYETDGRGRDLYISINNGGFLVKGMKKIEYKPQFPIYHKRTYHSLGHAAAPFRYLCDGSGRDSYVIDHDGGLKYDTKPLAKYHLTDFLRKDEKSNYQVRRSNSNFSSPRYQTEGLSRMEIENARKLHKIQSGVIKRLYQDPMEKRLNNCPSAPAKVYIPYLRWYGNNEEETKIWSCRNNPFDFKDTNYIGFGPKTRNKKDFKLNLENENHFRTTNNFFKKTNGTFFPNSFNKNPMERKGKYKKLEIDASKL